MQKARAAFRVGVGAATLALLWWSFPMGGEPSAYASNAVALVLGVLGALVTLHREFTEEHKYKVLAAFIVLGYVGFWVSARVNADASKKSRETERQIVTANTERAKADAARDQSLADIQKYSAETARMQALNTQLQERLLKSSEVIADLGRSNLSSLIGGDSYCYMNFAEFFADRALPGIVNMGRYPLYDVNVRVTDPDRYSGAPAGGISLVEFMGRDLATFSVGDIPAGSVVFGRAVPIPAKNKVTLNIFFSARNGFWTQTMILIRGGPRWKTAYRVFTDEKNGKRPRLLKKLTDKDFPVQELPKDWR